MRIKLWWHALKYKNFSWKLVHYGWVAIVYNISIGFVTGLTQAVLHRIIYDKSVKKSY